MESMFSKSADPSLSTEGFNPFDAPLFDSDDD